MATLERSEIQEWLGKAGMHVYSAQGTDKSCGIHAWFILMNVSLSTLSLDRRLRLSVITPPAVLNTRSDNTLAAGQASTSKA